MTEDQFMNVVDIATLRSRRILLEKAPEYSEAGDRLSQFRKMGIEEDKPPSEVLFTLANKHVTSIAIMVKHPQEHTIKQWREKLDDLRNYTLLLEGVLINMGIE